MNGSLIKIAIEKIADSDGFWQPDTYSRSGNHGGLRALIKLSNIKSPNVDKKIREKEIVTTTEKFKVLAITLNLRYIIVRKKNQKESHLNTAETARPEVQNHLNLSKGQFLFS